MEENLVGYLLKALDDETHRQVEVCLRESAELRARLQLLDRALTPLSADQEMPDPRPGLVLSTLARVAEYQCRQLPTAPPPPRSQSAPPGRHWLRRPDVLVAALLLIVLGGIGSSFLVHLWRDYSGRVECQNNLGLMWTGLRRYCDVHDGNFPRVEEQGPHSVAGIFVPVLCDSGMLNGNVSVTCPAQEHRPPEHRSVRELEDLFVKDANAFRLEARKLAGGYAYTLGYRDAAGYHGLRCDTGDSQRLPIIADRLESPTQRNSANHGGEGQNVLYLDGHVEWRTNRNAGINGDDIFVNTKQQVLAGTSREDTVLGSSDASPSPRE
jgi:prepilin-type processing-associated H-X9-DG protein